jgi:hypothetical protein
VKVWSSSSTRARLTPRLPRVIRRVVSLNPCRLSGAMPGRAFWLPIIRLHGNLSYDGRATALFSRLTGSCSAVSRNRVTDAITCLPARWL